MQIILPMQVYLHKGKRNVKSFQVSLAEERSLSLQKEINDFSNLNGHNNKGNGIFHMCNKLFVCNKCGLAELWVDRTVTYQKEK